MYIYIYIYIWSFNTLFDLSCADKSLKSEIVTARRLILYIYTYIRRFRKEDFVKTSKYL